MNRAEKRCPACSFSFARRRPPISMRESGYGCVLTSTKFRKGPPVQSPSERRGQGLQAAEMLGNALIQTEASTGVW